MTNKQFLIALSIIIMMGTYTAHSITKAVYQKRIEKYEQRDSIFRVQQLRMYDTLNNLNK